MLEPAIQTHSVDYANGTIFCQQYGSGPAVVFVHGGACDSSVWQLQVQSLSKQFRVVLLDLPAHGKSLGFGLQNLSMKFYAEAVNQVFNHYGVEKAVVIGHSLGVPVLREFYRSWPEKVCGLVSVDGTLTYKDPGFIGRFVRSLLESPLHGLIWRAMVTRLVGQTLVKKHRDKIVDLMLAAPKELVTSFFREMYSPDTAYCDEVCVPVLALFADTSLKIVEDRRLLQSVNPELQLEEFKGVGHFLMLEKANQVNAMLQELIFRLSETP